MSINSSVKFTKDEGIFKKIYNFEKLGFKATLNLKI